MASMYSSFSLQNITTISARTFEDLESAPIIIEFDGDKGRSEITIHTRNAALTRALVDAINGAVKSAMDKPTLVEAA